MASNKEEALKVIERLRPLRVLEFIKATSETREATQKSIKLLCDFFSSANPAERAEVVPHIQAEFSFVFYWFARRMAEKAIRDSSPEAIWDGLMALVLENYASDYRDSLIRLMLLYHSATKLGLNVEALFARAAALALNPDVAMGVRSFPLRPPANRSLAAFFYKNLATEIHLVTGSLALKRSSSEPKIVIRSTCRVLPGGWHSL